MIGLVAITVDDDAGRVVLTLSTVEEPEPETVHMEADTALDLAAHLIRAAKRARGDRP